MCVASGAEGGAISHGIARRILFRLPRNAQRDPTLDGIPVFFSSLFPECRLRRRRSWTGRGTGRACLLGWGLVLEKGAESGGSRMRIAGRPDRVFRARRQGILALREFGREKLDRAELVRARKVVERGKQFSELHGWESRLSHADCQSSFGHLIGQVGQTGGAQAGSAPPTSARTASLSATRPARAKTRSRCFQRFTGRRFETCIYTRSTVCDKHLMSTKQLIEQEIIALPEPLQREV